MPVGRNKEDYHWNSHCVLVENPVQVVEKNFKVGVCPIGSIPVPFHSDFYSFLQPFVSTA